MTARWIAAIIGSSNPGAREPEILGPVTMRSQGKSHPLDPASGGAPPSCLADSRGASVCVAFRGCSAYGHSLSPRHQEPSRGAAPKETRLGQCDGRQVGVTEMQLTIGLDSGVRAMNNPGWRSCERSYRPRPPSCQWWPPECAWMRPHARLGTGCGPASIPCSASPLPLSREGRGHLAGPHPARSGLRRAGWRPCAASAGGRDGLRRSGHLRRTRAAHCQRILDEIEGKGPPTCRDRGNDRMVRNAVSSRPVRRGPSALPGIADISEHVGIIKGRALRHTGVARTSRAGISLSLDAPSVIVRSAPVEHGRRAMQRSASTLAACGPSWRADSMSGFDARERGG